MMRPAPRPKTETDFFQANLGTDAGYYAYADFRTLQFLPGTSSYIHIRHVGEEYCEPGHYFDQVRDEYHMHFIMDGKGVFQLGDSSYPLDQGDIFLVPKGQANSYQASWDEPWHYFWVAFDGSSSQRFIEHAGLTPHMPVRSMFAPPGQYSALILAILEAKKLSRANEMLRMSKFYELFALLIRSRPVAGNATGDGHCAQDDHINHAIQYMQSNYRTAAIHDVAKYVGLNRSYFTTLFKREMRVSPQEYLQQYRMEKAANLLKTTLRRIGEISSSVGYDDPLSFSRAFHNVYGLSPRDFRTYHSLSCE